MKAVPAPANTAPDAHFPASVAGEDYSRYARAMRRHARRWLDIHLPSGSAADRLTMHGARAVLQSIAVADLQRNLYAQEERLLSELLQLRWPEDNPTGHIEPEIPAFLLGRSGR